MDYFARAAATKCQEHSHLNDRNIWPHGSGSCKPEIKVPAGLAPVFPRCTLSMHACLCSHGFPFIKTSRLHRWLSGKESACQCRRRGFDPWLGKIPWRRKWQPTPVFLPGKSLGQRSLAGYNLNGRKESDMAEHTHYIKLGTHPTLITVLLPNKVTV